MLAVAACAPTETIELEAGTVIIDVRTPAEFAAGHLQGAINIDIQSPEFHDRIAALPVDGRYVIYCRSGNRSRQAVAVMTGAGFTNLVDVGSVSRASIVTGVAVVTPGG